MFNIVQQNLSNINNRLALKGITYLSDEFTSQIMSLSSISKLMTDKDINRIVDYVLDMHKPCNCMTYDIEVCCVLTYDNCDTQTPLGEELCNIIGVRFIKKLFLYKNHDINDTNNVYIEYCDMNRNNYITKCCNLSNFKILLHKHISNEYIAELYNNLKRYK